MTDTPNRPPLSPLAQAVVDAHYGAPAMTTPNRLPLWWTMQGAYFKGRNPGLNDRHGYAAEIRALRDWLVPEMPHPGESEFWPDADTEREWQHNQRLRALLTAEADRAERGDHA